jgi:Mn-dependent DtxR family transcriptional regulator
MESRKKAKKLFDKYYLLLTYFSENSSIDSRRIYAKRLAIIAVDEIIENLVELSNGVFTFIHNVEYWQEVKQEIEKL